MQGINDYQPGDKERVEKVIAEQSEAAYKTALNEWGMTGEWTGFLGMKYSDKPEQKYF